MTFPTRIPALAVALAAAMACAPALAAIPPAERQALTDLYDGTDGANWTKKANWNGAIGTECTWQGVTCTGPAGSEHVTGLALNSANLDGTLPASLADLTELRSLNLFQNDKLTGPITPIGALAKLVTVSLGQSGLSGPVPSLAALTQLEDFEIRGAKLTGSTPSLAGLTKLKTFNLSGNLLDGQIGPLAGATALESFTVQNNQLTGPIPDLTGLASLKTFWVNNNRLTGITALAGLGNLDSFDASSNQLTGTLPPLAGLVKLRTFSVNYNQLSGPLPDLGDLAKLEDLYLRDNQFTGQLPASLSGLSVLRFLHVQNNQLVGAPPMAPNAGTLGAIMCPNPLRNSPDAAVNDAWDAAVTGNKPWADGCTGSWDVTPMTSDGAGNPVPNGTLGTIAPGAVQILPAGGSAQFTITAAPGYHVVTPVEGNCPGSYNAGTGTFTAGPLTANCTVNPHFAQDASPDDGVCGADNGQVLAAPPVNLCSAGTASAVTGSGPWNWSCAGTNAGATAQCSAQKAGLGWTVTAIVNGLGGTAAPASQSVANNARASVTAQPEPSYMLVGASGCGATFLGNSVSTAPVTADCTVTLDFAMAQATTTAHISVAPTEPRVNEDVAVRVLVEAGDTPVTSGTVAISGGGASCDAALDATGHGQCSLRLPTAGTHQITAAYPGDVAARLLASSAVRAITVAGAAGGVQPVPTLTEWGVLLLAGLLGLIGMRMRRGV